MQQALSWTPLALSNDLPNLRLSAQSRRGGGHSQWGVASSPALAHTGSVTLVLACLSDDFIVQVSDRQLTLDGGNPAVLPRNKAAVIEFADGRAILGFAGLARAGRWDTEGWMLEAVVQASDEAGNTMGIAIGRFAELATEAFAGTPSVASLTAQQRRTTFIFTGYINGHPSRAGMALVTNFQDFDTKRDHAEAWEAFRPWFFHDERESIAAQPLAVVQYVGAWPALRVEDMRSLESLIRAKRPHHAIVDKTVSVVRLAADRPEAQGTIGKDLSSVTLFRDPLLETRVGYHPVAAADEWLGVAAVRTTRPGESVMIRGAFFRADSGQDTAPVSRPRVGRNKPCTCGSGRKYKRCCGRD